MRKPVQIATTSVDHRETVALFALCDDGSMWVAEANKQNEKWVRLSDIPQEESEPATSPDVVEALRELAKAEGDYRNRYTSADYSGRITFLMFDKMRRAGDAAREVLKRIDEQEEPR